MTFNFLFIIGDELKTEKKKHQTMFDAYQVQNKCYHKICVHCTLVWKSVWKDAKITCKPPNEKAGDVFSVCTLAWYLATKDARWVRWSPCSLGPSPRRPTASCSLAPVRRGDCVRESWLYSFIVQRIDRYSYSCFCVPRTAAVECRLCSARFLLDFCTPGFLLLLY